MSGAKVSRVITKEEVMSICRGQIDDLEDTIEQWRKYASRHDALTLEAVKEKEKKLFVIIKMFEQEQFREVRRQCTVEISNLKADMNRIRDEAIAKAERERAVKRRLQYSAETLISTFKSIQRDIPDPLLHIASSALIASESELTAMNAVLSRILFEYTMSAPDSKSLTPLQKELSKKLAEGEQLQTLADWKIHYEDAKFIEKDRRLDKLIAELEATEDRSTVKPFLDRIILISRESSVNKRSLLTDSLVLDLVAYSDDRKAKDQAIATMREVRSELHRLKSNKAKDLEALLTKAIDSEDTSLSKLLCDQGLNLIKVEAKTIVGELRRTAVLRGLSELGYEVRENMSTAWAENGRIVVKKPNENGYGVELGAIEDVERMQIQLVSFEPSSDAFKASQDRDRETIWCSEFSRLQSLLEKSGTSLHIEKALPVGAKPLKQVKEPSASSESPRSSIEPKLRMMHD